MLFEIYNYVHLLMVYSPIALLFVDNKYLKGWIEYVVLILLLTPLHWKLFNNRCIITELTKNYGSFSNAASTESQFSETYFGWLYRPIMKLLNLKWDEEGIDKMVHIHWMFVFILIWWFIFFKLKCNYD